MKLRNSVMCKDILFFFRFKRWRVFISKWWFSVAAIQKLADLILTNNAASQIKRKPRYRRQIGKLPKVLVKPNFVKTENGRQENAPPTHTN